MCERIYLHSKFKLLNYKLRVIIFSSAINNNVHENLAQINCGDYLLQLIINAYQTIGIHSI